MKTINELLNEFLPEDERFKELSTLMPRFLEGEKIFYSKMLYVRYDKDLKEVYSGEEGNKRETIVRGSFPYIFYLSALYIGLAFAEKYKEDENLKNDKTLSLDDNGLVVLKGHGVIGTESIVRDILAKYEEPEKIVEDALSTIEDSISDNVDDNIEKEPTTTTKKKNTKKKKTTKKKTSTEKEKEKLIKTIRKYEKKLKLEKEFSDSQLKKKSLKYLNEKVEEFSSK